MPVTQATGRRKTAIAKIFLSPGKGEITINKKPLKSYFPSEANQYCVTSPLHITEKERSYTIKIQVMGGGTTGQKEAIRHGISRALIIVDPECRPVLKKHRMLRRDPRSTERKKYGYLKARKKAPFRKR